MFYSYEILAKKGPLAKIWLAAHWNRKLTKAQVFQTDIQASCAGIQKPEVPLALRLSGHLLLGVVRVYSRQVAYLVADCNEALVKIKMAFRADQVNLEDGATAAAPAAINVTGFGEFDEAGMLAELEQAGFTNPVIIAELDDDLWLKASQTALSTQPTLHRGLAQDTARKSARFDLDDDDEMFVPGPPVGRAAAAAAANRASTGSAPDVLRGSQDLRLSTSSGPDVLRHEDSKAPDYDPAGDDFAAAFADVIGAAGDYGGPAEPEADAGLRLSVGGTSGFLSPGGQSSVAGTPLRNKAAKVSLATAADLSMMSQDTATGKAVDTSAAAAAAAAAQKASRPRKRRMIVPDQTTQLPSATLSEQIRNKSGHLAARTLKALRVQAFDDALAAKESKLWHGEAELPLQRPAAFGATLAPGLMHLLTHAHTDKLPFFGDESALADADSRRDSLRLSLATHRDDDGAHDTFVNDAPLPDWTHPDSPIARATTPVGSVNDDDGDVDAQASRALPGSPNLSPIKPVRSETVRHTSSQGGLKRKLAEEFGDSTEETAVFQELAAGLTRRSAAAWFVELLALKSRGLVEVAQAKPFGNIIITATPSFAVPAQ